MNATMSTQRPTPLNRPNRAPARRRGLGVAELLLALAISASILGAVAYAVDATFRAYSINQEQSDLMQKSRLGLYRLVTTVRTTDSHAPVTPLARLEFEAGRITTDSAIQMFDHNNALLTYRLDPARREVIVEITPPGPGAVKSEYVLLRGVKRFEIKFEPMRSQTAVRTGGVYDQLMRATILLTIQTHGNAVDVDEKLAAQEVTLSTSVMPRQNLW